MATEMESESLKSFTTTSTNHRQNLTPMKMVPPMNKEETVLQWIETNGNLNDSVMSADDHSVYEAADNNGDSLETFDYITKISQLEHRIKMLLDQRDVINKQNGQLEEQNGLITQENRKLECDLRAYRLHHETKIAIQRDEINSLTRNIQLMELNKNRLQEIIEKQNRENIHLANDLQEAKDKVSQTSSIKKGEFELFAVISLSFFIFPSLTVTKCSIGTK